MRQQVEGQANPFSKWPGEGGTVTVGGPNQGVVMHSEQGVQRILGENEKRYEVQVKCWKMVEEAGERDVQAAQQDP